MVARSTFWAWGPLLRNTLILLLLSIYFHTPAFLISLRYNVERITTKQIPYSKWIEKDQNQLETIYIIHTKIGLIQRAN